MTAPRLTVDWNLIHPSAKGRFLQLRETLDKSHELGLTKTRFEAFEGYRTPQRQQILFDEKTSKARPWQSAHQYGLALDFVPWTDSGWSWDKSHDWAFLRSTARSYGLVTPLDWDLAHVEHPLWQEVRAALVPRVSGSAA